LGEGFAAKLSDFGLSRALTEGNSAYTKAEEGPLKWLVLSTHLTHSVTLYQAPETLLERSYSSKTDIWSFGSSMHHFVVSTDDFVAVLMKEILSRTDPVSS
jgi:serine/threonine protein kinase